MNKIETFTATEILDSMFNTILLFIVAYIAIDYQIFATIAFSIAGLLAMLPMLQVIIKIELYDDKLIVHKIFRTNEVLLNTITSIKKEKNSKEYLVIEYKEPSGYGNEIIYAYNSYMHKLIQEQL